MPQNKVAPKEDVADDQSGEFDQDEPSPSTSSTALNKISPSRPTSGASSPLNPNDDLDKHADDNVPVEWKAVNNGDTEKISLNYFQLYRYSTCLDKFLIFLGILSALGVGAGLPLNFVVFSDTIDNFIGSYTKSMNSTSSNLTASAVTPVIMSQIKWFCVLGACTFALGFMQSLCWYVTSRRQAERIRQHLFHAMIHQNMGWFDKNTAGKLVIDLTDQVNTIENGIGDKAAIFIQYFASFIGGIVISFVKGWALTLVALSFTPFIALSFVVFNIGMKKLTAREIKAYGIAGGIAEEVLSAIRTVYAFAGEKLELKRYESNLKDASTEAIRKALAIGLCIGSIQLCIFSAAALIFWFGAKLVREADANSSYTVGSVTLTFFCIVLGSISLGNALPSLEYFSNATAAANGVFSIIERKPTIDARVRKLQPEQMMGGIRFDNIHFRYPSRLSAEVLKDYNLEIKPGEVVALVGGSGSGKSTIVQMLQRFYDPLEGTVYIDGVDLRDLDLQWYRSHVGVVQQEPHLFSGTVIDNILMGRLDATREEVEKAARDANAYDFVSKLPQGFDTFIGEGGGLLSGGQKQRIAIARALLRNPKILLLDEATSALDNRSEKVVQEALDRAATSSERTVVMIAHRLSTVRNAHRIVVMEKGVIREMGSHEELMRLNGIYAAMVEKQKTKTTEVGTRPAQAQAAATVPDITEEVVTDEPLKPEIFTKEDVAEVKVEEPGKKKSTAGALRVIRLNAPEAGFLIGGCLASMVSGGCQPGFAMLLTELLQVFSLVTDKPEMERKSSMFAGILVALGFTVFISVLLKNVLFGVAGERLTWRLRVKLMESILKQEVGWFDEKDNQPGILTTRLANDASRVQGVSGPRLGVLCECITILVGSFVIGFVYSWQITLTVLAFMPLIFLAGIVQGRVSSGQSRESESSDVLEGSGKVALEILGGIRTVCSLGREERMYEKYIEELTEKQSLVLRSFIFAIMGGVSMCIFFFINAAVFGLGAKLVDDGSLQFFAIFRVFTAVSFGGASVGRAMSLAPDAGKASTATERIFEIIDREPADVNRHDGGIEPGESLKGEIVLNEVQFHYPTRPSVKVLEGVTFKASPGETVALVGSSGCGKSTVLQFMTRFYQHLAGSITVDGHEISSLNLDWLRYQCGLVQQEPRLFNRTIRENIAYGDNFREDVSMDEIIAAAQEANCHNFITALPDGYDTNVGARGGQLSGGQKQRIAIARALLRKPKLLLLDEATSALDSQSEVVVQAALDAARAGRTCLVIAHRLSTIQNADKIVVLQDGHVVEQGKHQELMKARGAYYLFHNTDEDAA